MGLIDLLRAWSARGPHATRAGSSRRPARVQGARVAADRPVARDRPVPRSDEAEPEAGRLDSLDTQPVEAEDRFELEEQAEEDRFNVEPIPTDTMAEPLDSAKPRRPRSRVAAAAPVAARVPRKATPKKAAGARSHAVEKAGRIPVARQEQGLTLPVSVP